MDKLKECPFCKHELGKLQPNKGDTFLIREGDSKTGQLLEDYMPVHLLACPNCQHGFFLFNDASV